MLVEKCRGCAEARYVERSLLEGCEVLADSLNDLLDLWSADMYVGDEAIEAGIRVKGFNPNTFSL